MGGQGAISSGRAKKGEKILAKREVRCIEGGGGWVSSQMIEKKRGSLE